MTYYVYILQSLKNGQFYIGQTQNVIARLEKHNNGFSKYTSKFTPWNLVWVKVLNTRKEAFKLEQSLKKLKSRQRVIYMMKENPCIPGSENIQISDLIDFRESS